MRGEKGPKRDAVVINSAFGLLVSGKVKTVDKGISLAKQSIDEGKALKVMEELIRVTNI